MEYHGNKTATFASNWFLTSLHAGVLYVCVLCLSGLVCCMCACSVCACLVWCAVCVRALSVPVWSGVLCVCMLCLCLSGLVCCVCACSVCACLVWCAVCVCALSVPVWSGVLCVCMLCLCLSGQALCVCLCTCACVADYDHMFAATWRLVNPQRTGSLECRTSCVTIFNSRTPKATLRPHQATYMGCLLETAVSHCQAAL